MNSLGGSGAHRVYWQTQLPVDYLDTSLVINTPEDVSADLSGGKPAKLWILSFEQTNNGATDEDIELDVTINGTAYTFSQTAVSGTVYYCYMSRNLATGDFEPTVTTDVVTMNSEDTDFSIPFVAASVGLIEVQQTSTVDGTSAQIEVNLSWEKLVGV
jgi:hypothetical protein